MMIREYRLITKSALVRLSENTSPVIVKWANQWLGLKDNAVILSAHSIDELRDQRGHGRSWLILQRNENEWIGLGTFSALEKIIIDSCFGTGVNNNCDDDQSLASRIVYKVAQGLSEAILAAMSDSDRLSEWTQDKAELPEHAWDVASGAAFVTIRCGESTVELVLSPLLVSRIVDAGSSFATDVGEYESVSRAIESERVVLNIAAGVSDVSLNDLRTMAVGDVIKLNKQVNEPFNMFMGPKQVGQALLGAKDGLKAIRVLSFQ